jgi:hypothetical protein
MANTLARPPLRQEEGWGPVLGVAIRDPTEKPRERKKKPCREDIVVTLRT